MKTLINLATLKLGGGQNVGLNFVKSLIDNNYSLQNFHFIVAKNSAIEKFIISQAIINYTSVSANPIKRIFFEIFRSSKILKDEQIEIIYTLFGFGFFAKSFPQVIGSADSNLYFPEIDFWEHYKGISRVKKWIIDAYRIYGVKKASGVIFENEMLEKRGQELFHLKNTIFIPPSINLEFKTINIQLPIEIESETPIGLFLCSWQLNKNILLIPQIAATFKKKNQPFHILITATVDNSKECLFFLDELERLEVSNMVSIVGQVNKNQLQSLYNQIDYVFLLSKLESFSNNIIEAWYFNKILVIADELWSHSICDKSAIYVNRDSSEDIVKTILELESNKSLKSMIRKNAEKKLASYPTIGQKTFREIQFLKSTYENH